MAWRLSDKAGGRVLVLVAAATAGAVFLTGQQRKAEKEKQKGLLLTMDQLR